MAGRARAITGGQAFVPFNVGGTAATLDVDFTRSAFHGISGASAFTLTRAGIATNGLFTDAAGSTYDVFPPNAPRITSSLGALVEVTRTQYLGVTDTPATQTTASLGTGTYCLWVIGTGSATPSAGTATITGAAAATAGSPNTFTVTVAGTVTVTVSGGLTRFQLENGLFPTSYIPNLGAAGTSVTRNSEIELALTGANFTPWFTSTTAGTVYCEAAFPVNASDTSDRIAWALYQGAAVFGARQSIRAGRSASATTLYYNIANAGTTTANITGGSPGNFAPIKFAAAYAANDAAFSISGAAVLTDTSVTVPTGIDRLVIGNGAWSGASGSQGCGYVRRIAFFPERLSDASLQALTA